MIERGRESSMRKAFIRSRVISAAVSWYKSGCAGEAVDALHDAVHELLAHEEDVDRRAEDRKYNSLAKMNDQAESLY